MESKLNIKDVQFVCETININLLQYEMEEVLRRYDEWEDSDQNDGDNWSLAVENIIYQILSEKQKI
tara:strand:- start:500 stop:697 length:198 start_codon:yes stop_codon:yes gene_type:complete